MASLPLLRAAAAGASSGLRSFSAPAAVLGTGGSEWAGLATFIAGTELIFDKLPITPSRLTPPALGARVVSGALCGAWLAGRGDASRGAGALCGATAAIASAFGGHAVRSFLTKRLGWPDAPVALLEDFVAIGVARRASAR